MCSAEFAREMLCCCAAPLLFPQLEDKDLISAVVKPHTRVVFRDIC